MFSTFVCAYIKYKLIFTMLLLNFLYYMKWIHYLKWMNFFLIPTNFILLKFIFWFIILHYWTYSSREKSDNPQMNDESFEPSIWRSATIHNIFAANSFLARSLVAEQDIAGTLSKLCLTTCKEALATFLDVR